MMQFAQSKPYSTGYIGPVGSGNYVKMVHNGIEYGDMQLIAEVYDVLRNIVGMSNEDMSRQFARWNDGALSSYLIEITAKILNKADDQTGKGYVIDYVSIQMEKNCCSFTKNYGPKHNPRFNMD